MRDSNKFTRWSITLSYFLSALTFLVLYPIQSHATAGDIIFVTQPPLPTDFATINSVFGNQKADISDAPRGGDIYIRYADGTLKNLTKSAGLGQDGLQGASSIAVRDPAVHWSGAKIAFSMAIGAPSKQYEVSQYRWQLYEMSGLGKNETPVVTKVANQPAEYNNVMPAYATDDQILFVTDRPINGSANLYPQRDEYESTATNSGLWKLNPTTGDLLLLDHAPSGDFHPLVDSFGRVIFTRWDHLQRDQQADAGGYGAFDYSSEGPDASATKDQVEVFPEARSANSSDRKAFEELHTINQFFPWMTNEDGTDAETLNHIGRHELAGYIGPSRKDDPNIQYAGSGGGIRTGSDSFLEIREDPLHPGRYFAIAAPEFSTHAAGQIIYLDGAPTLNPDSMRVSYVTHIDTRSTSDKPSAKHSGFYRNPLPLSSGALVASHTISTREDKNEGNTNIPTSRYSFRLKNIIPSGDVFVAGDAITPGIKKTISFWSPDSLVQYSEAEMWELQPVELISRQRPLPATQKIPDVEQSVFSDAGVDLPSFKEFLRNQNLSLIVSRNVTTRDSADRQQPFNLRIPGTTTETLGAAGKIYDISFLQIFQGDLLRGYGGNSAPQPGRRVLARPMHDLPISNPPSGSSLEGSVALGSDGSMAAFVPARRALTWQVTDPSGQGIVRERYWLTFQPGEIRVCTSCHGVNTFDQGGHAPPTNKPEALATLLAAFRSVPHDEKPRFSVGVIKKNAVVKKLAFGEGFGVDIQGNGALAANRPLSLKITAGTCSETVPFATDSSGRKILLGKVPNDVVRGAMRLSLIAGGTLIATNTIQLQPKVTARKHPKRVCKPFMRQK